MKTRIVTAAGIALMMLALGCTTANEKQASDKDLNFEAQLTAALPLADQGFVLKICNTNEEAGDHGSLSMSILSEKPDPDHLGKTISTDPITLEKQLAAILNLMDQDHSLNIRQEPGEEGSPAQLIFTVHKRTS